MNFTVKKHKTCTEDNYASNNKFFNILAYFCKNNLYCNNYILSFTFIKCFTVETDFYFTDI